MLVIFKLMRFSECFEKQILLLLDAHIMCSFISMKYYVPLVTFAIAHTFINDSYGCLCVRRVCFHLHRTALSHSTHLATFPYFIDLQILC